ncbi:MAG: hypothetical protein P8Y14_01290 [Anaerolineales bacterium]|jgi:hypothetical protein
MTTEDFIITLFCRVDNAMPNAQKHSQASLYPSEVVTLAILFALKGVGNRAFYRWLVRDYQALFPKLPAESLRRPILTSTLSARSSTLTRRTSVET